VVNPEPWDGQPGSLTIDLPPLAVTWWGQLDRALPRP
jgi:hypothetical protein